MNRRSILVIASLSILLTGCGTPSISSSNSSSAELPSSSLKPISSSLISSSTSSSSISSLSSSQELVEDDGVIDLSDIERAFKNNVGVDKTFSIRESREIEDIKNSSSKRGNDVVSESTDKKGSRSAEILSSDGKNGIGFYSCDLTTVDNTSINESNTLVAVENDKDSHIAYNSETLSSNIVDNEYLYNVCFKNSPIIELAAVNDLDVSYFEKFTVSPDYVKASIGADAFPQLTLNNYFNIEFGSEDGVYWQSFICGTTTTFREIRLPTKPDGRKHITNASFDYRYSLAIEWSDDQLISLSIDIWETSTKDVYDFVTTETTGRSYTNSYRASFSNERIETPSYDKSGYQDNGIIESSASFVIPLKDGEREYRALDGKMGDPITNEDILSKSAFESEIDVNVYEDSALKRKVDLSSLKLKSYAKTYYIDFNVPKRTSYTIMETALRRKSDIAKGDITFKTQRWTEMITGPLASWGPDEYVIVGYPESTYFATTELIVLATNDKIPVINTSKMAIKGGYYYVIRNCADEK